MLSKQAAGLEKIVGAAGGSLDGAVRMMITDKLEDLVKLQVEAVSGLKIDKVTVWDGAGGGADGKTATAGFLSGLLKSLPPLNDVYKMAGLELPDLLSVEPKEDDLS
jgi:flotillin